MIKTLKVEKLQEEIDSLTIKLKQCGDNLQDNYSEYATEDDHEGIEDVEFYEDDYDYAFTEVRAARLLLKEIENKLNNHMNICRTRKIVANFVLKSQDGFYFDEISTILEISKEEVMEFIGDSYSNADED